MQITVSQENGRVPVTVIRLNGPLNMGTSELLESQGRQAYEAGARHLLIDLSQLTSLTSAGLRAILRLTRLFTSGTPENVTGESPTSGRLHTCVKLLNPNQQIENVLMIAGFIGFLEIFYDPLEAINSF